ncbi:MAG: CaiB/BaiF CoA transferase family protein [Gammaproteobacteria bacterium]
MLQLLRGVKVLDFGAYFAGPYGSRLLADLGADVIKLEAIEGDSLRATVRVFHAAQRGKRAIAVNLKEPDGREIGQRLARWADVIQHNLRPGAAERLGLDYETVRALNPQVIYAYSAGWGSDGPDARRQGFAPLYSGYVGLHHEAAGAGNPPLQPIGNEDNGNGLLGAAGMLMALFRRRRTGQGGYFDHFQLGATMMMAQHMMRGADGRVIGSTGLDADQAGVHPLIRLYRTADGWLCISAAQDRTFAALCGALGHPQWSTDARFSGDAVRRRNAPALIALVAGELAALPAAQAFERLDRAGVPCEIPAGKDAMQRFFEDPEQSRMGRVESYAHPTYGPVRDIAVMLRVSGAGAVPGSPSPLLGQHTAGIMRELGYADAEIHALGERRVIR